MFRGKEIIEKVETITKVETRTVEVPIERIIYRNLPGTIETVYVASGEKLPVASTRRVIKGDTVSVRYFFPPANRFDISLGLAPRKAQVEYVTTTERITVRAPTPFFKGLYAKLGMYSDYGTGLLNFADKVYVAQVGFTLDTDDLMIHVAPLGVGIYPYIDRSGYEQKQSSRGAYGWSVDMQWYFLK